MADTAKKVGVPGCAAAAVGDDPPGYDAGSASMCRRIDRLCLGQGHLVGLWFVDRRACVGPS